MRYLYLIAFLAISIASTLPLNGQTNTLKAIALSQSNGYTGTQFVLGFPPNERENFSVRSLAIYIAATEDTEVRLLTDAGIFQTINIKANETALFSSANPNNPNAYSFSWEFENWVNERPVRGKAVIVESDRPISVYVINSKTTTSEGYQAIPTASWGDRYIHNSFWDFNEGFTWGGGFQVLAIENDTRITILLKGKGQDIGETTGGKRIGDVVNIQLNKGELYQIQGNGQTRGVFDLSGSEIAANKPIGLISYHNSAMIPKQIVPTGRDHLSSMMPPLKSWGKSYASVELDRGTGKGDYYRVIASEDNTNVDFSWFDIETGELTKKESYNMRANEVWSTYDVDGRFGDDLTAINGTVLVEADKPILVKQYAYSAGWDSNGSKFDPFMFPLIPRELWAEGAMFQTPQNYAGGNAEYNNNYLTLMFMGDSDKAVHEAIVNSITIDNQPLSNLDPTAFTNNIPGTDIFYSRLQMTPGSHIVTGDTKLCGYIYGFSTFDSYAWPSVGTIGDISESGVDTPSLNLYVDGGISDEGEYQVLVHSNQDFAPSLISSPFLTSTLEENAQLEEIQLNESVFKDSTIIGESYKVYSIQPLDGDEGANGKIAFTAVNGIVYNELDVQINPISKPEEFVSISNGESDFGIVEIGNTAALNFELTTNAENPSTVTEIVAPAGVNATIEGLHLYQHNLQISM